MPFTRFWELLAGSLLALYLRKPNITRPSDKTLNILSIAGAMAILYSSIGLSQQGFPGYQALFPVIGTALIIYAGGFNKPPLFNGLLSVKPIVNIGLISYPLYLWHWVLLSFAWIIVGGWETKGFELIGFRALLILIAFVLSILTYYLIEKPIRFGKKRKGLKAVALIVVLAGIGGIGSVLYIKGAPPDRWLTRSGYDGFSVEKNPWGVERDDLCKKTYLLNEQSYCRFIDAGAKEMILLVGDSHARHAFEAIAEYNKDKGANTLLFGHNGNGNPIINEAGHKYYQPSSREKIIDAIRNNTSIKKVYIFMHEVYFYKLGADEYRKRLQAFIDDINATDRKIYIVENNPVLSAHIKNYMTHPLNVFTTKTPFPPTRTYMLERKKGFYDAVSSVKGLTLIRSLDAWCPIDNCLLTDENGRWLYYDDNHITTIAGGRFLVEKVLKPYLDE
jgi:hypothetical protein